MKLYRFFSNAMYVCGVVVLLMLISSCSQNKEEKQCLSDIKNGLQKRLDVVLNDESFETMQQSYIASVDAEMGFAEQYKTIEFENKEFQTLIINYISALENEKEAANLYFFNNAEFKQKYYKNGKDVCIDILNKLMEDYKFSLDKAYSNKLQNYINGIKRVGLNETVNIDSENGEISIEIESFSDTDWKKYSDFSELKEYENIGLLKCTVQNNSYYDEYNPEYVSMDDFIGVYDSSFIALPSSGTAYQTGSYEPFGAGFGELKQGQKKKIAIPYIYNTSETLLYVQLGEAYSVFVPIEAQ